MGTVTVTKGGTFYRRDESLVFINHSEKFQGTNTTVFKEEATSTECWTAGGNNFPGGTDPAKCLVGFIPPKLAAMLKRCVAPMAGKPTDSAKVKALTDVMLKASKELADAARSAGT